MQFFQLKNFNKRQWILVTILLSFSAHVPFSHATQTIHYPFCKATFLKKTDNILQQIYAEPSIPKALPERIQYFSQLFLNKPYALTALGEGRHAEFDQAPLYRFDAFDCQTYVETVLALVFADSPTQFKQYLNHIRYAHGEIEYVKRHHFTSPDWNAYNQRQRFLEDITTNIVDQNRSFIARYAQTTIDQANWYRHFDSNKIRICAATKKTHQKRLQRLRQRGQTLPNKTSRIAYIPIKALTSQDKSSQYILDQIPNGAIIEIVRPNWDLTQIIGTHLNVSHIGFVLREQNNLYFYQASSLENKVFKIPLVDYLISMLSSPTIQGINIQVVLKQSHGCRIKI